MSDKHVRKQECTTIANGARISLWHLDTEAELEALMAPGGLDPLAGLLDAGDRVSFVAGADRVRGDFVMLEATPAKGAEPAIVAVHLIWSTRPVRTARKAAA